MLNMLAIGTTVLGMVLSASNATAADAPTKDIVDTAVAAGSFTTLAKALEAAGLLETLKGTGPFTVVDQDLGAARAAVAACTAGYLGAMGDIYPRLVAEQGLASEVEMVRATRTVPAEAEALLDEFTVYGSASTVRQGLARWDDTLDITLVGLPPGLPWPSIEATLHAAAPAR